MLEAVKEAKKDEGPWILRNYLHRFCNQYPIEIGAWLLQDCLQKAGTSLGAIRNSDGWTTLHGAACYGYTKVVELLLSLPNAQEFIIVKTKQDNTAFDLAKECR